MNAVYSSIFPAITFINSWWYQMINHLFFQFLSWIWVSFCLSISLTIRISIQNIKVIVWDHSLCVVLCTIPVLEFSNSVAYPAVLFFSNEKVHVTTTTVVRLTDKLHNNLAKKSLQAEVTSEISVTVPRFIVDDSREMQV